MVSFQEACANSWHCFTSSQEAGASHLYVVIRVKVSLVVRLQGRLQNSRLFSQNQSELA